MVNFSLLLYGNGKFWKRMREATALFLLCLRCWGEYLYRTLKRCPPPCTNRIKRASAALLGAWLGHDQRNWCPGAARLPLALPPVPSVDNFSHTLCNFGSQHGVGAWSIPWWSPAPCWGGQLLAVTSGCDRPPSIICPWLSVLGAGSRGWWSPSCSCGSQRQKPRACPAPP